MGSAVLFRAIQLAWLPIALVGYVLILVRMLVFARESGTSATTLASLYTRWMQHRLGTRPDVPCARLMAVLPGASRVGLTLTTGGTMLGHRITGYVQRLYRYPYPGVPPMIHQSAARTTFFDTALHRHLAEVDQLVVLGAGYDTRAFRIPDHIRCFELDQPDTQRTKRNLLARTGLDMHRVTFVPANFRTDDWLANLTAAGFDPRRPAFFLWEAVTMYLDRRSVEETLRAIAGTAPGSVVAFDYFNAALIASKDPVMRYARAMVQLTREPFMFGLDLPPPARSQVERFLTPLGLTLTEHRTFGRETPTQPVAAGFATAVVRAGP
ncbi:MAG TPA: SAM-dependent methyltransferase [Actinophytocola sp.]|uniref:class I SAM-dependent methyltransferase n=1 Tax=Actinophytocola sp. TaxID=1872138 RepID=UPI002DBD7742|nr:SAM-dependent methyltransferase [Actinophytocola sp.]HEU5470204.1 SAM-dependent methyltransferase [Actinophytocola sp.]